MGQRQKVPVCIDSGTCYLTRPAWILRKPAGVTLIELLLTLAVLSILAAILIPQLSGDLPERLAAAAQILSADLDYARSLAVTNNTSYKVTFDVAGNKYDLRHSGTNSLFNTLPGSPFRQSNDPADKQTTNLSQLPLPAPGVRLAAVVQTTGGVQSTTTLEFNSLGGTTCASQTIVWLSCGTGNLKRYISVYVDPITGLVTIGPTVTALPSAVNTVATSEAVSGTSESAQAMGS